MKYLENALDVVENLPTNHEVIEIKANIFLNLSSVHSLESKHDIALNYCSKWISILAQVYNKILNQREKQEFDENEEKNEPYNDQYSKHIERTSSTGSLLKKLSTEDEKIITSLVIAYYNSGVEFEFMNDKKEGRRFYKLAYDIALKELGYRSYLTTVLSERVIKPQSDGAASTNPSENDVLNNNDATSLFIKKKIFKVSKRRRVLNSKLRKQLNISSLFGDKLKSIIEKSKENDSNERSLTQMKHHTETNRIDLSKINSPSKLRDLSMTDIHEENKTFRMRKTNSKAFLNKSSITINPNSSEIFDKKIKFRRTKIFGKRHKAKKLG